MSQIPDPEFSLLVNGVEEMEPLSKSFTCLLALFTCLVTINTDSLAAAFRIAIATEQPQATSASVSGVVQDETVADELNLEAGANRLLTITLRPGSISESISVQASNSGIGAQTHQLDTTGG